MASFSPPSYSSDADTAAAAATGKDVERKPIGEEEHENKTFENNDTHRRSKARDDDERADDPGRMVPVLPKRPLTLSCSLPPSLALPLERERERKREKERVKERMRFGEKFFSLFFFGSRNTSFPNRELFHVHDI